MCMAITPQGQESSLSPVLEKGTLENALVVALEM